MSVLKPGDRGPEVEELQRKLLELGYDPDGIDGIFGPKTERAVKNIQADAGLPINGIVGPGTWTVINQAIVSVADRPIGLWAWLKKHWYLSLVGLALLWGHKT